MDFIFWQKTTSFYISFGNHQFIKEVLVPFWGVCTRYILMQQTEYMI